MGLPCGGEIDVWVQELEPGRFVDVAGSDGRAAEVTSRGVGSPESASSSASTTTSSWSASGMPRSRPTCAVIAESVIMSMYSRIIGPMPLATMRGIAAVAVMLHHLQNSFDEGGPFYRSYLFVDFFRCSSSKL